MSAPEAPPLSASEEIRSGWVFERNPAQPPKRRRWSRRRERPSGPKAPLSPTRLTAIVTLGTLTLLAAWFVLYALVFSGLQENHAQHVLYTRLRANLASSTLITGQITPGSPVALISAPSIHLRSVVVEGTTSKDLAKGPGHFPTSPLPGQAGLSVIFGRSATFGSPFGKIASLHPGASIQVTTGQGVFTYLVTDVRRPNVAPPANLATNVAALRLVTSEGSGWRSGWAPTQVVYVEAGLVGGKVKPTPAGRPTVAPKADLALAGDTGGLVPLVFWLQGMVLVAAGLVYAHNKWTTPQLWLVGLPLAIAVLWGATSTVLLLLPNLA
jgi:sortase A